MVSMASNSYARSGTRYRPIPRAETVRLIKAAQRGGAKGKAAMQTIIEQNMGLVHSIAGRYDTRVLPATVDRNDLIAEGLLGLMHAVRKFDPTRGTQFSTYAVWWVRQKMQRFLQKQTPITASIQIVTRRERLARVSDQFMSEYGRSPSLAELAELAELTSLSCGQVERAVGVPAVAFSLDAPPPRVQNHGNGFANDTAGDYVAAPDDLAPIVAKIDAVALSEFLESVLPVQHWQVLRMRLGLGASAGAALNDIEVGERLGVSRQRANIVYQEALEVLRRPEISRQLLALLDPDASELC